MTIEALREMCRRLPGVSEDVKWGGDLCFLVGGKMFVVVNLEPPHQVAFKCTPESFGELVERPGIVPAPYMARNMWVQEQELGETLDRFELEAFVRASYSLVIEKLPKSKRPGAPPGGAPKRAAGRAARRPWGGVKRSGTSRTARRRAASRAARRKR